MALEIPKTLFGKLSSEEFLDQYWQKKPLLVRNAWPNFITPLLPTQLKKLACDERAESRLILERGGEYPWEARFGPFEEEELDDLPESHWTLLVQHVDSLLPEIGHMLSAVDFLPNWRLDDIMISYAPGEGGVGAHIDNYDVFLLQAHGQRRWQIQNETSKEENLVPDLDVRMLSDFKADQEWILDPGDMLYLPPRIAHFGVALGHCLTFSIGCRAPSREGLITSFMDDYLSSVTGERFFADPDRNIAVKPGKISEELKLFAEVSLREILEDPVRIERWLGKSMTQGVDESGWSDPEEYDGEPVDDAGIEITPDVSQEDDLPNRDTVRHWLSTGLSIQPRSATRMAFDRLSDGALILFVAGEAYEIPDELESFVDNLTRARGFNASHLPDTQSPLLDASLDLICELFARRELVVRD